MALTDPTGQPLPMQPGEFVPSKPTRSVTFALQNVPPPSPLYIDVDDQLAITTASNGVATITVNARVLLATGQIISSQFVIKDAGTRAPTTKLFPLAEGYLLSCSAIGNTITRGVTFVRGFINRGAFGSGQPGQLLFADYVTAQMGVGFPTGRIISPQEGPGNINISTPGNPAAGANLILQVPNNARWLLRGLGFTLTTSATVATRIVQLALHNTAAGNIEPIIITATISQAASLTQAYDFVPISFFTEVAGGANSLVPIPADFRGIGIAGANDDFRTSILNLQGTDQVSAVKLQVEEWLDGV